VANNTILGQAVPQMTPEEHCLRKSEGHLTFGLDGAVEFYEQDGEVYRARSMDVFDITGRRYARWECSRAHFERYRRQLTTGCW
jgi:hypothetical protein